MLFTPKKIKFDMREIAILKIISSLQPTETPTRYQIFKHYSKKTNYYGKRQLYRFLEKMTYNQDLETHLHDSGEVGDKTYTITVTGSIKLKRFNEFLKAIG